MSTHWMNSSDWKQEEDYERIWETYRSIAKDEMIDELRTIGKVYLNLVDKKKGFIDVKKKGLALEFLKQAWTLGYYIFNLPEEEPFDTVEYEFDEEVDEYLNENLYPVLLGDDVSNKALITHNLLGEMYGKQKRDD